ncbi:MAG TPA: hypothetical protein VFT74_06185 [Isosphaeraceae bacterium]|nr:hypothetical protein [Isosphaeraceae bacterium]
MKIDGILESLEAELAEARRRLEEAQERRAEIRKARARTIHAPVVHESLRRSIALIVRYERMYVWHRYDAAGNRLGPNLDEIVVVGRDPEHLFTTPDPLAGIPIESNPSLHEAVSRRLSAFPADRFDLQIVVRADSFGSFHALRSVLHSLGYECSILMSTQGSIVDRGGIDRGVQ